jgi:hypothetical protein
VGSIEGEGVSTYAPVMAESRRALVGLARAVTVIAAVAGTLAVVVGVWFAIIGRQEVDEGGEVLGVIMQYQLRPAGVVLIALGLLLGPLGVLVGRTVRVWASEAGGRS